MSVDIHALSGAYAVDAVDDIERMHFERHLADCSACRAEVDSLRATSIQLAEISVVAPPAALRDRVLADIATVRPLPPLVASVPERGRAARRRFPALVAAAVALIAIGGAGATAWHPWSESGPSQNLSAAQSVLSAPDAEAISQKLNNGATATVTRSAELNRAVISADGLEELPDDLVYELWFLDGDSNFISAGFLEDPSSPTVLQGKLEDATAAGITIEQAGGSSEPTLDDGHFVGTVDLEDA